MLFNVYFSSIIICDRRTFLGNENVGRDEGNDVNVYNAKSTRTRERTKETVYLHNKKTFTPITYSGFEINLDELSVANAVSTNSNE